MGKGARDSEALTSRSGLALLAHGIFFQVGSAFSAPTTVIPMFAALLTRSSVAIGVVSSILLSGELLLQLIGAHVVEGKRMKKPWLTGAMGVRALSWLALAVATYLWLPARPELLFGVLLVSVVAFSLAGSLATVAYADIVAKVFAAEERGRFFGVRFAIGGVFALLAGTQAKSVLGGTAGIAYPHNYALLFALTGLAFAIATFGLSAIDEPRGAYRQTVQSWTQYGASLLRILSGNPSFRWMVGSRLLLGGGALALPYYVLAARSTAGVSLGTIGSFVVLQVLGESIGNLTWGRIADGAGNKRAIVVIGLLTFAVPLVALWGLSRSAPGTGGASAVSIFYIVFLLVGGTVSGIDVAFNNMVLELAPADAKPTCIALKNTLMAPLIAVPIIGGFVLKYGSFHLLFGLAAIMVGLGVLASTRIEDPRGKSASCVR
jgi:hypothetical protein